MAGDPTYTRRLLLGHGFGAALTLPKVGLTETRREKWQHQRPAVARPLIILDPGHGGKDPGAIGVSGTYEKHVTFAAAGELAQQLSVSGQYRVSLTRESDIFIALQDRVAYAQTAGASLFISMHADALADHMVSGASVYTLAADASDLQTAQLAKRENEADRFGHLKYGGVSPHVAEILAGLVHRETRAGSARMQQNVVAALSHRLNLLENPSRHAAFAVLKAANIPSVLIEMGFMSNAHDESALRRVSYRALIATAIKRAIDQYFASSGQFDHIG